MTARIVAVAGASQSGKTSFVIAEIAGAPRVFAWDPDEEFAKLPGWRMVTTRADLARLAVTPGACKVAFVVDPGGDVKAAFGWWARCMFTAAELHGEMIAIADELADVTTTSKAPPHWGTLVRRGLKRGVTIIAISQRWAEADKTALGNASEVVMFRQSSADDVRYLAKKTRVDGAAIHALTPYRFIRYDCRNQIGTPGQTKKVATLKRKAAAG